MIQSMVDFEIPAVELKIPAEIIAAEHRNKKDFLAIFSIITYNIKLFSPCRQMILALRQSHHPVSRRNFRRFTKSKTMLL